MTVKEIYGMLMKTPGDTEALSDTLIANTVFGSADNITMDRCEVRWNRSRPENSYLIDGDGKMFYLYVTPKYLSWLSAEAEKRQEKKEQREPVSTGDILVCTGDGFHSIYTSNSIPRKPMAVEVTRVNQKSFSVKELNLRQEAGKITARKGDYYEGKTFFDPLTRIPVDGINSWTVCKGTEVTVG